MTDQSCLKRKPAATQTEARPHLLSTQSFVNITLITHSWGGSRGASGGLLEPPKMKQWVNILTILFLVKKDLLNNNTN